MPEAGGLPSPGSGGQVTTTLMIKVNINDQGILVCATLPLEVPLAHKYCTSATRLQLDQPCSFGYKLGCNDRLARQIPYTVVTGLTFKSERRYDHA